MRGVAGVKRCLFCNETIGPGEGVEHVFPQWLLEHLSIRDDRISPTHTTPEGEVVSMREMVLNRMVEGRVCSRCNSGWMSDLESRAKPLLVPLMEGDTVIVELSYQDRALLGRWAAKTAFLLNRSSNFHDLVPDEHFRYLYDNQEGLPERVIALGQQHHGDRDFYWMQGSMWHVSPTENPFSGDVAKLGASAYKMTLQFGKLLLLVANWPHSGYRYGLWKGIHLALWPLRGPVAWYDLSDEFPWDDSIEAIATFHASLMVRQETPLLVDRTTDTSN